MENVTLLRGFNGRKTNFFVSNARSAKLCTETKLCVLRQNFESECFYGNMETANLLYLQWLVGSMHNFLKELSEGFLLL